MRNLLSSFLFVFFAVFASAQNVSVTIKVTPASEAANVSLFISPLTAEIGVPVEMKKENNVFKAEVPASPSAFFNVVSVRNGAQMFFPIYGGKETVKDFEIDFSQGVPQLSKSTAEDMALGKYFEYVYANDKKVWTEPFASLDEVRPFVEGYLTKAEELASSDLDPQVVAYLKMWAYTHTSDIYDALPLAAHIELGSLSFNRQDLLKEPVTVLDSEMGMLFRSTPFIVLASLKDKKNLDKCLSQLYDTYTEPTLLKTVSRMAVENYLAHFDYESNYEKGLQELKVATPKYGLNDSYLKEFVKRKSTIKGQPFPEGVVLKDVNGKTVDFSAFRGKYVYVDMWASWCGPCCKEVPVLQQLEKELKNDKVAFVSISLDTRDAQWKKKMEQLGMHGNQLINSDNSLGNSLNVQGIPFFLIYDPDGKLYMYNAPRPSQGPGLVELLENLK